MQTLYERYRFFHEHAGYVVGRSAEYALRLARAEARAQELGLKVSWEDETDSWESINGEDCAPAPPIHVQASVRDPEGGFPLASLGSIGLLSWRDPYVRVVEAELFAEVLDEIDAEAETRTTHLASEMAARPSYAGA